jgi:hypothetical protein
VAAIGQGRNDSQMLATAALGIAVFSKEGLAIQTLMSADLVVADILTALELFERPMRIVASLTTMSLPTSEPLPSDDDNLSPARRRRRRRSILQAGPANGRTAGCSGSQRISFD